MAGRWQRSSRVVAPILGAVCIGTVLACAGGGAANTSVGPWSAETLQARLEHEGWSVYYCNTEPTTIYCAVHSNDLGAVFTVAEPHADLAITREHVQQAKGGIKTIVKVTDLAASEAVRDGLAPPGAGASDLNKDQIHSWLSSEGWEPEPWQSESFNNKDYAVVDGARAGQLVQVGLFTHPGQTSGTVGVERSRHPEKAELHLEGVTLEVTVSVPGKARELLSLLDN